MTKNLPKTVQKRMTTLASDLADLLAAVGQDERCAILLQVFSQTWATVSACDKDAEVACENWLG